MSYFYTSLLGLFLATFLSATLVPFSSEIIFLYFLTTSHSVLLVLALASLGNTLGSIFNFEVGRMAKINWLNRLGASEKKLTKWKLRIFNYGHWMGLLACLPFIGDIISLAMGYFRAKRGWSYLCFTLGKTLRYSLILIAYLYFK